MNRIGSYDAKTRLPALLANVSRGASYTVTRRGEPVAMIVPYRPPAAKMSPKEAVKRLRGFRKTFGIKGVDKARIKKLIAEGRRF